MRRPQLKRLSHVKYRHLLLIVQLAEYGTLHKAAQYLGISQPAATAMLRDLESLLGLRLFERSSRGVMPTGQAKTILDCARTMLNEFDNFAETVGRLAEGQHQVLRVGLVPQAYATYLAKVIGQFRAEGGCTVKAVEGTSRQLLPQLRAGELDCMIGRLPVDELTERGALASLSYVDLYDEDICIAASAHRKSRKLAKLDYRKLAACEWVLRRGDSNVRKVLSEAFLRHGEQLPEPVLETANYLQSLLVVQGTDYLTVVPRHAVEARQNRGLIRAVNFALDIAPMQVSFITRAASKDDTMIALFKDAVVDVMKGKRPYRGR